MLWLGCGRGKCWGYGTELLLADGGVKQVQNIVEGDKLAHPVSGYQTVTGTTVGRAPMYRVSSTSVHVDKFQPFTCNGDHILVLEQAGRNVSDGVVEMTVNDYMKLSDRDKRLRYKLYRSSVDYSTRDIKIDPYVLGVWLGDGHHNTTQITLNDSDAKYILPAFHAEADKYGLSLRKTEYDSHCTGYSFTHGRFYHGKPNWLFYLREYGICHSKNIPDDYLYNDKHSRYELLAGLLDTDGYLSPDKTCFEIVQKHKIFAERICQLVSGLGMNTSMREKVVNGQSYWRVHISGDTHLIPTRVPRKTAKKRKINKRFNVFGFKVEEIGEDLYYGFTLDGDGLCLLKDCIVTHNTPITLTTIEHRMRAGVVKKVLVFGPLRVIHAVWEREARKWSHTKDLRFSIIGWPNEERRLRGLFADADIYLCNYENMGWLSNQLMHYYIDQGQPIPFDMVVYDEVTKCKNSTSQRIKGGTRITNRGKPNEKKSKIEGWRKIIPHVKYTTGLTGTPSANGYLDLHGQYLVVDGGERLGKFITHYKDTYFIKGWDGWTYTPSEAGKQCIETLISDITIQMDNSPNLPPLTVNDIIVDLPSSVMDRYKEVEQDMYARLDDGTEIEVFNRASVSNKCLQFANGAAYTEPGQPEWVKVHDEKLEALDSIIEEAQGKTILLGYSFKSDAERIMKRYKKLNPVNLTKTKPHELLKVMDAGNRGEIKLMIGHAASLGHGVDGLNDFCNIIVWYGMPWSLELYEQMIGRIAAGERFKNPVTMHRIIAKDTIDHAVVDALVRKDGDQTGLKAAINRYRQGLTPTDGSINFM
jgi:hypothetical protein